MIQKMKQNLHKTIKLALIVALTFIVCSNVSAMDCSKYKSKGGQLATDFGISMKKDGNNYIITMDPKSSNTKLLAKMRKVTFTVTKIEPVAGNNDQLNKKLVYGTPLVLNIQGKEYLEVGGEGVSVKLNTSLNGGGNKLCSKDTDGYVVLYSTGGYQSEQIIKKAGVKLDKSKLQKVEQGLKINCGETQKAGSFEAKFCEAKNAAIKTKQWKKSYKNTKDKERTMVNFTDAFTIKKAFKEDDDFDAKDIKYKDLYNSTAQKDDRQFTCKNETKYTYEKLLSSDDIYYKENTNYMFGSGTKTYDGGYYWYHFKNSTRSKGKKAQKVQCKITCEEAVVVKYGPPVAQKAGACFQYKMKVESYVTCYMKQAPKEPKVYDDVCSPTPQCTGHDGKVWNQGGPNEDFDQCIKSCDNGKYTDKCNKKCYKEIYGEDDNNELPLNIEAKETAKTTMSHDEWVSISKAGNRKHSGSDGYYILRKNGSIDWEGSGKGRWYTNHSWGIAGHNYNVLVNGIPKTEVCTDSCKWIMGKCAGDNIYLNYGVPEADAELNTNIYNAAVDKCKAKATCTKTHAEFTISATYRKPKNETGTSFEEVTVKYPYNTKENDKISTCNDENKYDTQANSNTTILHHESACYSNSCNNSQNHYMTEWSFPGAWTKKKTGEISYVKPDKNDTSWRERPNKFCLPKDTVQVNRKWAVWYYKYIEKLPSDYYCDDLGSTYSLSNAPAPEGSGYNIKGRAIRFGFYEWNISIKCFYAIEGQYSTSGSESGSGSSKDACETTKTPDYKIRTVTNSQLFPGKSSATTTGGTVERAAGYNWTEDSTLGSDNVTENYANNPVNVKKYIEKVGNSIYSSSNSDSNKYVDYEFRLTPENIKTIKKYNNDLKTFDIFCGKLGESSIQPMGKDNNITITYYYSNLFRGDKDQQTWASECSRVGSNLITPKRKVEPGCNNNNGTGICNTSYSY